MRIAFINEKGGTGKTTLAVHFAAWLAREGHGPVLLIDLDPQGQAAKSLALPPHPQGRTTSDLLADEPLRAGEAAITTEVPDLAVVAADKRLAALADRIGALPDAHRRLDKVLSRQRTHAHIVFDSPPSLGGLTRNVLYAADRVVVPVQLSYLALDGCAEIVRTIDAVRADNGGKRPTLAAIVPTFHRRTRMAEDVLARLHSYFPAAVTPTLGFAVAVDEAQSWGRTIWDYRPGSPAATSFGEVCRAISDRLGMPS